MSNTDHRREIERRIMLFGSETVIRMREMFGEEDEGLIVQCSIPTDKGEKLDTRQLWLERLSRTIVSPSMPINALRRCTRKELTLLKTMWLELNEAYPSDFLGEHKSSTSEDSSFTNSTTDPPE